MSKFRDIFNKSLKKNSTVSETSITREKQTKNVQANDTIPTELINSDNNVSYGINEIIYTKEDRERFKEAQSKKVLNKAKYLIMVVRDSLYLPNREMRYADRTTVLSFNEFYSILNSKVSQEKDFNYKHAGIVFDLPSAYPFDSEPNKINRVVWLTEDYVKEIKSSNFTPDQEGYSEHIRDVVSYCVAMFKIDKSKGNKFEFKHFTAINRVQNNGTFVSSKLFNSFKSEANMWSYLKTKLFPAHSVKNNFLVSVEEQGKHSYLVAGTGSGKSELIKFLIVQEILKKQRNTILIDPHGDLATEITNIGFLHGKGFADDIIYFDTLIKDELYGDYNDLPVINPFEIESKYLKDDVFIDNCSARIFDSLGEIIGKESSHNMQALLIPCIAVLLKKKGSTLFDLKRFMNDELNEDLVALGKKSHNPSHREYFKYDFFTKSVASTKQAVSIRLQTILNNTLFSKITCGKTTIDLNSFIRSSGKHLIINLNKSTTSSIQRPLGSLILTSIINYAYTLNQNERVGVHLYVDEFQNFVTQSVEEILSQLRKYKVYMTLAHQYTDQIEDPLILKSVLANTNIKMVGSVAGNTVGRLNNYGEKNLEQDQVDGLSVGEFLMRVKSRGKDYHKIIIPPVLLDKNTKWVDKSTKIEWLKNQYKNYYKTSKRRKEIKAKEETKTKGKNDINFNDFLD